MADKQILFFRQEYILAEGLSGLLRACGFQLILRELIMPQSRDAPPPDRRSHCVDDAIVGHCCE